ncbi:MAG: HD domain-containing phosphohydrolase [Pseudomonadota bacterium]
MATNPKVLVVDDDSAILALIREQLQDHYEVALADGAREALHMARGVPAPALIVLDAAMPEMSGFGVCRQLKADPATAAIPVIFLTDQGHPEEESRAFAEGASDYVRKPFEAPVLRARVAAQLELHRNRALLADQARHLEQLVATRTAELEQMHDATILAMASLAETRDSDTCNHIRRTQHYVVALARKLAQDARFGAELSEANIALLYRAAPLHDIGKVGVPEAILLKPGRLTDEEYEVMKMHTVYGRDAILDVEKHFGASSNFLRYAGQIAYSHQERWDGSGYPQGLKGEAIPLSARLMAVADVYDAMISRRVYKPAFTHETALELIRQGRGEHFDPDVVDAMLMIEEQIMEIAARFSDPE